MNRKLLALAGALAFFAACDDQPAAPDSSPLNAVAGAPTLNASAAAGLAADLEGASSPEEALAMINDRLAAAGSPVAVQKMEYVTGGPEATEAGQTVFATDRTLRLTSKWAPNDARRLADGELITQATYEPFTLANGSIDAVPSINASFDTWNAVQCSKLDIETLPLIPSTDAIPSAILSLDGMIGDPFAADIVTIGFLPGSIFDLVLGPGASTNVLGVTFTFVFIDAVGNPTDVDSDGRDDTALKEVWYNDAFLWSTDGGAGTDIETVALHENGHALELGHFGRVAGGNKNGKLHVSPRAVMNAFILGTLRAPLGTDNGAYCSNYARWPS